jgi:hypothetical protein
LAGAFGKGLLNERTYLEDKGPQNTPEELLKEPGSIYIEMTPERMTKGHHVHEELACFCRTRTVVRTAENQIQLAKGRDVKGVADFHRHSVRVTGKDSSTCPGLLPCGPMRYWLWPQEGSLPVNINLKWWIRFIQGCVFFACE